MARNQDEVFVLGEEQLEPAAPTADRGAPSPQEPAAPRLSSGWLSRAPRLSARLAVGAAMLLALGVLLLDLIGGGEPAPPTHRATQSAPAILAPFPRAHRRDMARRSPKLRARHEAAGAPSRFLTKRTEREPLSELAPVSPPPEEPAPPPPAVPAPVSPPVAPSPAHPVREGSGAGAEFSFER